MATYKNGRPVRVGDRVVRGPDWLKDAGGLSPWKDQDGNPPGSGTVTKVGAGNNGTSIYVQWDCGGEPQGRAMGGGTFRVQLASGADVAAVEKASRETYAETLMQKCSKLFNEQEFSDVLIVCGEMTFYGHKAMIASQSDVFCRMFKDDMVEGKTNRVVVEEMEPDTLKAMLRYIYTGNLDPEAQIMEVLAAAQMYNVQTLKSICEEHVVLEFEKEIKPEEVLDLLVFADLHCCSKIMEIGLMFIGRNKKEIANSAKWQKVEKEQPEFFIKLLKKMNGFPDPDPEFKVK